MHAESETPQVGPCARAVSSLYGGELLLSQPVTHCPIAPSFSIRTRSVHNILQYAASHATRTCPFSLLVAPSCSSKCDALLEIIHIIRRKSFVCCQVVLCVFLQQ